MAVSGTPARATSIDKVAPKRRRGTVKPQTGRRPGKSGSREDIVRAARQLFADRGYAGTTMRAIAQKAKVDSALIHHFFGSKDRVFAAAIQDIIQPHQFVTALLEPGHDGTINSVWQMFRHETQHIGDIAQSCVA